VKHSRRRRPPPRPRPVRAGPACHSRGRGEASGGAPDARGQSLTCPHSPRSIAAVVAGRSQQTASTHPAPRRRSTCIRPQAFGHGPPPTRLLVHRSSSRACTTAPGVKRQRPVGRAGKRVIGHERPAMRVPRASRAVTSTSLGVRGKRASRPTEAAALGPSREQPLLATRPPASCRGHVQARRAGAVAHEALRGPLAGQRSLWT
jgi:hypothetical protein